MLSWMSPETALFLLAALAAVAAYVAARADWHRASRALAGAAFAAFFGSALVWMFSDTYGYYVTGKTDHLRLSHWGSYREHEMWKEILAAFRERYPEIPVHAEYVTDRYEDKVRQGFVAGDAPDVMLFQDEPLPNFAATGKLEPLDAYCRTPGLEVDLDDYWDTSVESFRYKGTTYGIPIWGGDCLIIYNRDAFKAAGVPEPPERWSMDEFLDTCERLVGDDDGDGRMDRYAFVIPGWIYWLPFDYAFGAEYLNPARTRWARRGPEAEESYQFWQDLRYKYHVSPRRDELTEGGNVAFMTGRAAMFVSGPWAMPPLNEAQVNYDVAHIPSGPGGHGTRVTWDCLMMSAGSQRKDEAWQFIHFATSLEAQKIVAKFQRSVPALKAAQEAFVEGNPSVHAERFIDAFEYARMQPISEHWQLMSREVTSATDLMLDNNRTVSETLSSLEDNRQLATRFLMQEIDGR